MHSFVETLERRLPNARISGSETMLDRERGEGARRQIRFGPFPDARFRTNDPLAPYSRSGGWRRGLLRSNRGRPLRPASLDR
jgi:hypothetical protein